MGGAEVRGLRLGRVCGVPVVVRRGWAAVAALLTWAFEPVVDDQVPGLGAGAYAVSAAFAVLLYASVLVHELGHSLLARRLGLGVTRIEIGPLGGGSLLAQEPAGRRHEAAIAAVGPVCSLVLGALGTLAAGAAPDGGVARALALELAVANLLVGVVNLLPGLPFDGGRVLVALRSGGPGGRLRGVRSAALAGRTLALVVAGAPFAAALAGWTRLDLALVVLAAASGAWLWVSSAAAARTSELRLRVPGLRAGALLSQPLRLPGDTPVSEALRRAGGAGVAVVDGLGRPVAYASARQLRTVPELRRPWTAVGGLAAPLGPAVTATLGGRELLDTLAGSPAEAYGVTAGAVDGTAELVGVLVARDVAAALGAASQPVAYPRRAPGARLRTSRKDVV
ncbi:M50 family metallopeptidase [Motilibacter peucedani]|uniref:M50 family metallopeptidase n=1 Tax=Motilibacter peucedani TaxID=598650 RepID=UPI00160349CA|nr:M50 family metallopeptidase [Motilibacter peucedani]